MKNVGLVYYSCEQHVKEEQEKCLEEIRNAFLSNSQQNIAHSFLKYFSLDFQTLMNICFFTFVSMLILASTGF